jgi:hypothetical protein
VEFSESHYFAGFISKSRLAVDREKSSQALDSLNALRISCNEVIERTAWLIMTAALRTMRDDFT